MPQRGALSAAPATYGRSCGLTTICEDFSCRSLGAKRRTPPGPPSGGRLVPASAGIRAGRTPSVVLETPPQGTGPVFRFWGAPQHSRCSHRQVHKTSVGPLLRTQQVGPPGLWGRRPPAWSMSPPQPRSLLPPQPLPTLRPPRPDVCSEHLCQASSSPESLPRARGHFLSPSRSQETSRLPGEPLGSDSAAQLPGPGPCRPPSPGRGLRLHGPRRRPERKPSHLALARSAGRRTGQSSKALTSGLLGTVPTAVR